jgi:hypothetical protein
MANFKKTAMLGALDRYSEVINKLPSTILQNFFSGLEAMYQIGVAEYGRRVIYPNGKSFILTTSNVWYDEFEKSVDLQKSMISHMSSEISLVKNRSISLITRSEDKQHTEYLKILHHFGLNNSVLRYYFFQDRIEISYFVAPKDDKEARDIFLNKITLLIQLEERILPSLRMIHNTKNFKKSHSQTIVYPNIASDILHRNYPRFSENKYLPVHDQKFQQLTHENLLLLKCILVGWGNIFIAEYLNLSESTIKRKISDLKEKLCVDTKKDLIEIAGNQQLSSLLKQIPIQV